MAFPHVRCRRRLLLSAAVAFLILFPSAAAHGPSCPFSSAAEPHHHDQDDHHHHQHHHHHRHNHDHHRHGEVRKLPEELAEEEDLALFGFDHGHHDHDHDHNHEASALGVWLPAMGCSLLVSMASLVCLIIVPVFFLRGKPSRLVVDSLAVFGAGAMLGDAFLHQLPHAFGGEHSHSHDHLVNGLHEDHAEHGHSHAHSLKDLSVGLSVLSGIVLFLLVEKVVRYVEDSSGNGAQTSMHGHHPHKKHHKLKDNDDHNNSDINSDDSMGKDAQDILSEEKSLDGESNKSINGGHAGQETLRKRGTSSGTTAADAIHSGAENSPVENKQSFTELAKSSPSSLVFGYLNLFSDGVHNFTDGMALGSAFLLYGSVGGWSRTMFLLAHELPQEIGDFGILVRSGFTVSKALFFNFLSALVALAGTALALVLGKDPGHSSLIEGFTAGGFIYIAVAGVLPEMNSGRTTFKSTSLQLTSLILGVAVALFISLVE